MLARDRAACGRRVPPPACAEGGTGLEIADLSIGLRDIVIRMGWAMQISVYGRTTWRMAF